MTPLDVIQATQRRPPDPDLMGADVVLAGAGGALGNALLARLTSAPGAGRTQVLVKEPFTMAMRSVSTVMVSAPLSASADECCPPVRAQVAVVAFDAPRLYHQRERALWMPQPHELLPLATWLRAAGVHTLAVVLPHAQGRLPAAVQQGLANLDEQALVALGFDRLLLVRTPRKPEAPQNQRHPLQRLAQLMLSIFGHMVPPSEQPVRPAQLAGFVASALRHAPLGTHVAAPETVWNALQGDTDAAVKRWLKPMDGDAA